MDRVVSDFHDLSTRVSLSMGWCPAQHDTQLQGFLARLNKRADVKSQQARTNQPGQLWTMPKAWVDGHSFAWFCKGKRVQGIKQMARECMPQAGETAPSEQGHVPMEHMQASHEDARLRALWPQCVFRHPREQAGALLAAFYENTRDMYIDTEGQGVCVACQQPYECRVAHAHLPCPCLWQNVIAGMGDIARICVGHVRRGVAVRQVWGGLQLQGHGVAVLLVWMPPRHSAWCARCMQHAHITLWPIFPVSVPSELVTEALKILSAEPTRHLCMRGSLKRSARAVRAQCNYLGVWPY